MKYRILVLMLLIMSLLHSKVVIDPTCKVTFGASDIYISGGLQMDIPKTEEPNIDLTRKILGKDVKLSRRDIRNDIPTKSETKNANVTFDLNSRLYFIGDGDANLTNVYALYNTTVAKPSGNLIMNSDLDITGNLDFSSGNIITGANTLTLNLVSNGNLSGESATSYVVGTVIASRLISTGASTFGNIGFAITNTGNNLGTATVTREAGIGSAVDIYNSNGINRKWTLGTSVAFAGTRSVTASWLSNEDNGNTLTSLKAWKYEASKSDTKSDEDIVLKKKISMKSVAKSGIRSEREFTEDILQSPINDIVESDPKTLGWVEVSGASFNTASSPRTSTFTIDASTIFTINDVLNAFADGSGTESNPYQIATLEQLNAVRSYLTACFIQIADIDASATSTWDAGAGWNPIGNSSIKFTGKYDGQHYAIDGLFVDRGATSYIGLFGYTTGSEIYNVELTNVDVTGGSYTGGLIGYNLSSSILTNSSSEGVVTGTSYVGGLVGRNNTSSIINHCLSKGSVEGTNYVGGLVGVNLSSEINNSYSWADVSRTTGATSTYIAGFAAYNGTSIIANCYSTGSITFIDATNPTNLGFMSSASVGTINNSFWNTELSGQSSTAGTATGITTNEMRTLSTFTDATWDFQVESDNGTEDIWGMNFAENNAFPFLSWQGITHDPTSGFAGGMGTESEPFLISNLTELDNVRNFETDYYFLQTADIDASATIGWDAGAGWMPIGTSNPYFTGSYDGDGHKISNLYFDRAINYTGLFGVAYPGSVIKNLGLVDIDANGGTSYSGTISGYTRGVVSNCFSTGTIKSNNYIGGLIGYVQSTGNVTDCYSQVEVTRNSGYTSTYVAGFAGNNLGIIQRCYSKGTVTYEGVADPTSKGFAGSSSGTIADCFWDMEVSGQTTSAGTETGKTTAEMQDVATYTNTATVGLTNPWDFVGNPNNDTANDDYWNIHISLNGGYPYFEYEGRIPVLAPGNIALVYLAGDVTLTWDAVAGAAGYAVYSSVDPYGTFTLDESGGFTGEQWDATVVGDSKMFYFVTATNATKETPKQISMSNKVESR